MGIIDKLFKNKRKTTKNDLAGILNNVKGLVFEQERFKEAAKILEEASEKYPNSAPVQYSLGVTYSKIAGEYNDQDAVRPWALKSCDAFEKSLDLASRYGELNDEQIAKARESTELLKSVKEEYMTDKLITELKESQGVKSVKALEHLAFFEGERVKDALIESLNSDNAKIRMQAADSIDLYWGRTNDDRVVVPLIQAMNDPSAEVRSCVAKALGSIGMKTATDLRKTLQEALIKTLQEALQDNNLRVRETAKIALSFIKTRQ